MLSEQIEVKSLKGTWTSQNGFHWQAVGAGSTEVFAAKFIILNAKFLVIPWF